VQRVTDKMVIKMKEKIKSFWCNNLYPFCDIEKVEPNFEIVKDSKNPFNEIFKDKNISKNEHIQNSIKRKKNIQRVKEKGGFVKYLINWMGINLVYVLLVDFVIKPKLFLEKLPYGIIGTALVIPILILILAIFLEKRGNI
jgi:hypothetical protein